MMFCIVVVARKNPMRHLVVGCTALLFIQAGEKRDLWVQNISNSFFSQICLSESLNKRQTETQSWAAVVDHSDIVEEKAVATPSIRQNLSKHMRVHSRSWLWEIPPILPYSPLLAHSSHFQGASVTQTGLEGLGRVHIHTHALTPGHHHTHNESPLKTLLPRRPCFLC